VLDIVAADTIDATDREGLGGADDGDLDRGRRGDDVTHGALLMGGW
jgi:hypothetical protein